ncbi:hypothetical protein AVEN_6630-1, partial [Araneus ventricosus]
MCRNRKERVLEGSKKEYWRGQRNSTGVAKEREEDLNSTDLSDCGSEKSLAYIEISKKLVSDVRENFPT